VGGGDELCGARAEEFSTRLPVALDLIGIAHAGEGIRAKVLWRFAQGFMRVAGFCTSAGFFLFTRIMIPEALYALEYASYSLLRGWHGR